MAAGQRALLRWFRVLAGDPVSHTLILDWDERLAKAPAAATTLCVEANALERGVFAMCCRASPCSASAACTARTPPTTASPWARRPTAPASASTGCWPPIGACRAGLVPARNPQPPSERFTSPHAAPCACRFLPPPRICAVWSNPHTCQHKVNRPPRLSSPPCCSPPRCPPSPQSGSGHVVSVRPHAVRAHHPRHHPAGARHRGRQAAQVHGAAHPHGRSHHGHAGACRCTPQRERERARGPVVQWAGIASMCRCVVSCLVQLLTWRGGPDGAYPARVQTALCTGCGRRTPSTPSSRRRRCPCPSSSWAWAGTTSATCT